MSEIRELLAAAQQAEIRGDVREAGRLLDRAARWYESRQRDGRAQQMLRHAARLRANGGTEASAGAGLDDPEDPDELDFGFGDGLTSRGAAPPAEPPPTPRRSRLFEPRTPVLADPAEDAWCSFCCRPAKEVGALVGGPTGAYLCRSCLEAATRALGEGGGAAPAVVRSGTGLRAMLPGQARALERLARVPARVVLLLGPPGAGKSTLATQLGTAARSPFAALPAGTAATVVVDLPPRLVADEAAALRAWLGAGAQRRLVLVATGVPPPPALRLAGEHGEEAIYDTSALVAAAADVPAELLEVVELVVALEAPDGAALGTLAVGLLEERATRVGPEVVQRLVELALESGRGAAELAALVRRIPSGRYPSR